MFKVWEGPQGEWYMDVKEVTRTIMRKSIESGQFIFTKQQQDEIFERRNAHRTSLLEEEVQDMVKEQDLLDTEDVPADDSVVAEVSEIQMGVRDSDADDNMGFVVKRRTPEKRKKMAN